MRAMKFGQHARDAFTPMPTLDVLMGDNKKEGTS